MNDIFVVVVYFMPTMITLFISIYRFINQPSRCGSSLTMTTADGDVLSGSSSSLSSTTGAGSACCFFSVVGGFWFLDNSFWFNGDGTDGGNWQRNYIQFTGVNAFLFYLSFLSFFFVSYTDYGWEPVRESRCCSLRR
jgi:hypothetical protein